jgi:hypothetical protein
VYSSDYDAATTSGEVRVSPSPTVIMPGDEQQGGDDGSGSGQQPDPDASSPSNEGCGPRRAPQI